MSLLDKWSKFVLSDIFASCISTFLMTHKNTAANIKRLTGSNIYHTANNLKNDSILQKQTNNLILCYSVKLNSFFTQPAPYTCTWYIGLLQAVTAPRSHGAEQPNIQSQQAYTSRIVWTCHVTPEIAHRQSGIGLVVGQSDSWNYSRWRRRHGELKGGAHDGTQAANRYSQSIRAASATHRLRRNAHTM